MIDARCFACLRACDAMSGCFAHIYFSQYITMRDLRMLGGCDECVYARIRRPSKDVVTMLRMTMRKATSGHCTSRRGWGWRCKLGDQPMSVLILLVGLAVGGLGMEDFERVDLTFSFSSCSLIEPFVFNDSRLATEALSLVAGSALPELLRIVGVADVDLPRRPEPDGTRVGVADAVDEVE